MGNQLFNEYNIEKTPFIYELEQGMKIYKATHKQNNKKVCVFIWDKKELKKTKSTEEIEKLHNKVNKGVSSLLKYKHPNILGIVQPFTEDDYVFGFISESFEYNLTIWEIEILPKKSMIDIKLLVSDLLNSIKFLHEQCNVIHSNISPNSIYIDSSGKVKLGNFDFLEECVKSKVPIELDNKYSILNPNLSYSAPELILKQERYFQSDIYSIGVLIYNLIQKYNKKNDKLINLSYNLPNSYKEILPNIQFNFSNYKKDEKEIFEKTLSKNANDRININQLLNLKWFNDNIIKSLLFIDNLPINDSEKNKEFLKEFPNFLSLYDVDTLYQRILPSFLSNLSIDDLINPLLPPIFSLCDFKPLSQKINFEKDIWPHLKKLFKLKSIPAQSLYFILKKMPFIGENISQSEYSNNCNDIICKALDCGFAKIQIVVIDNINSITEHISLDIFLKDIFPRMMMILKRSNDKILKQKIIISLKNITPLLDNNTLNGEMLNNIIELVKIENSYEVCYQIIDLLESIQKGIQLESISEKVIPTLIYILKNGKISKKLYKKIKEIINNLINQIGELRDKEINEQEDIEIETNQNINKNINDEEINIEEEEEFLNNFFNENSKNQKQNNNKKETNKNIEGNKIDNQKENDFDIIEKPKKLNIKESKTLKIEEKKIKEKKKKSGWDDDEENEINEESAIQKKKKEEEKIISKPKISKLSNSPQNNLESLLDF